ncbi:hypothetical protein BJY52DRAFT_1186245 [Lactarius psammicola]|nr:hypothetical protein BJY52DRAFT_1186245 [Lactarius psammicola]
MAPPNTNPHDDTPYLDALLDAIPDDAIPPDLKIASTSHSIPKFIDAALRLASGGSSRPDDDALLRGPWPQIQASLQHALHALGSPPAHAKRKRSLSPSSAQAPPTNNKKPKHEEEEDGEEDPPHLTLHALSATAPVRHKVDITLHTRSLRLAHATTGVSVARCARTVLTRAFLLPTRARATGAPQWTALLLAGDTPTPPPSAASRKKNGAGTAKGKEKVSARFELACSVSEAGAVPRLTTHHSASTTTSVVSTSTPSSSSAPPNTYPPPSSPHQALLYLLSSLSTPTPTTATGSYTTPKLVQIERGAPLAGITAFRGARETSLWFLDGAGVLADTRPAEFWALSDLARGDTGVRVRTATGRTCTVVLTRCPAPRTTPTEESEEDDEGEETEFQMIDGKERERIAEWARRHKSAFGIAITHGEGAEAGGASASAVGGVVARGDSDSDSDFEQESEESDGGSPSPSGSSSDPGEHEGSEESGNEGGASEGAEGSAETEGDDGDDEEIVELDPKRHPLLRAAEAGAIPKMSRAAVDAAVGLVVDDLVGRGSDGPGPPALPPTEHRHKNEDDEDSEEEDELED